MKNILDFLNYNLGGNTILQYMIFLCALVIGGFFIRIFSYVFIKKLERFTERTKVTIDDFLVKILRRIIVPLLYLGLVYVSINTLNLPSKLSRAVEIVSLAILGIFIGHFINEFISYLFSVYLKKRGEGETLKRSLGGLLVVIKVLIWGSILMFFLDNIGFKVSTILAGLGIGGVAVALAAQAILGDLFSYFSIVFDRPFEVGDFIIIGDYMGTVEYIGIKTTRIRSLSGEQVIFSNTDLTNSRVKNYRRMERRRVVFQFGVVYQTPLEKLKKIPKIVEEIITSIEDTLFDRAHFFSFGDFSLVYEVVYYVLGNDYKKYMDIQEKINLLIKERFEKENIDFAHPTQTLYVYKV